MHNETANIWSHLGALGWVVHRSWETSLDETTSADARLYTQVRVRVTVTVTVTASTFNPSPKPLPYPPPSPSPNPNLNPNPNPNPIPNPNPNPNPTPNPDTRYDGWGQLPIPLIGITGAHHADLTLA